MAFACLIIDYMLDLVSRRHLPHEESPLGHPAGWSTSYLPLATRQRKLVLPERVASEKPFSP
jgi:hypothetical protein